MCRANGSFMWSDSLFLPFFLKKKIPEEETNKQKPTTKQNTEG